METKDIVAAAGQEDINAFEKGFTDMIKSKAGTAIDSMKDTVIANTLDKIGSADED